MPPTRRYEKFMVDVLQSRSFIEPRAERVKRIAERKMVAGIGIEPMTFRL